MKKITWMVGFLLAAASLFTAKLQAQSNPIYFPYVVNDSQTSTELILTNVTGRNANVILVAYRQDGSIATQISTAVGASSQTVLGPSVFPGFQGWVLGASDVAGVLGDLRLNSSDGAAQTTTESSSPDTAIVFPLAAESPGTSTEIALVNPTPVNARVGFTAYGPDGRAIATNDLLLAPFGMIRGSLTAIFGSGRDFTNVSHVIARYIPPNIFSQVVNLVGFEVVRGFVRIPNDPTLEKITARTDWGSLAGSPFFSAGNSMTFANVTRDMGWFSLVGVVNLSDTTQTVTFTYATAANANAGARSFAVPGNGSIQMTAIDLFGPGQDSGSVRVTSGGSLAGFLGIGTLGGSSFATAAGQSKAQTEFFFPTVNETSPSFTGIALLNDNAAQATVDLYLINTQGATFGHTAITLSPGERVVRLAREFFIEGFNATGGYVFVRSSSPIFAMALSGNPDKTLNEFAAQPTVLGFIPPAQRLFVIKGQITDNVGGAPASGVSITLSRAGSPDITATTDAAGVYLFKNLTSGDYTVTPNQPGRMFAPVKTLVQLNTASAVVNFIRGVSPAITTMTVVTNEQGTQVTAGNNPNAFAIFGTSEVSLKITGSNFAPGQTVFFGSRAVSATNVNVVGSSTIFVKLVLDSVDILAELAPQGYYGSYNITIGGQSPFTDSRSNALPFYILPPLPVLMSVVSSSLGTNQTFARYETNSPGETLTVAGFGFRPGAKVLFDGRTALNGIEVDTKFISSYQLQVYLPPQALRSGGIYSLRVRNESSLPEASGEAVNFQVNNLRPEITSIDPPGPLQLIGPGPTPVSIDLKINGSNFHDAALDPASSDPGTLTYVSLKIPDIFPAIVPVGGQQGCITINGRTILRVRVYDASGAPAAGVFVTFTAPGIDTETASGYFLPGAQSNASFFTDSQGYAPSLTDSSVVFQANLFAGGYIVKVGATVGGIPLKTVFNITNLNPGQGCTGLGGPGNPAVLFVSSTQLIVTQFPISSPGTYSVMVANASPGGGFSREVEFVVTSGPTSGVPTISPTVSLSPAITPAGSSTFNLTVFRDTSTSVPFQSDAWVNFGTVRLNRIAGDTSADTITVSIPSFLIASPGLIPVTVTNPGTSGNTGGTSTRVFFTVTP